MTTDGIVIDEQANTLTIARHYPAPVGRVWLAWTDPDAIARWWGPRGWTTTVERMDVRPGGQWWYSMAADDGSGGPVHLVATYSEVRPQERLSYLDRRATADWIAGGDAVPTDVAFSTDGTGTRVSITAGFPDGDTLRQGVDSGMGKGYLEALERLDSIL